MDTLKAIFGTIVAVAVIFGSLALYGGVVIVMMLAAGIAVVLGVIVAIYLALREEFRSLQDPSLDKPPDP